MASLIRTGRQDLSGRALVSATRRCPPACCSRAATSCSSRTASRYWQGRARRYACDSASSSMTSTRSSSLTHRPQAIDRDFSMHCLHARRQLQRGTRSARRSGISIQRRSQRARKSCRVRAALPPLREQRRDRRDPRHPRHHHPPDRGDHREAQAGQAGAAARPADPRHRRQRRTAPAAEPSAPSLQGLAAGVDSEGVGRRSALDEIDRTDWTASIAHRHVLQAGVPMRRGRERSTCGDIDLGDCRATSSRLRATRRARETVSSQAICLSSTIGHSSAKCASLPPSYRRDITSVTARRHWFGCDPMPCSRCTSVQRVLESARLAQIECGEQAGTQPRRTWRIASLLCRCRPIDEQQRIVERLDALDGTDRCRAIGSCQKLRTLKSGLMDDLLTGRVRVTPLLA